MKILRASTPTERLLIEPFAKDFREARERLRLAASALIPELKTGASFNPDTLNIEGPEEVPSE
jgi:hypothetical protein